jgi:hypothetical protein
VNKVVDTMARALVTDGQKTFLIGGIGSSVMCGHDNCHYDRLVVGILVVIINQSYFPTNPHFQTNPCLPYDSYGSQMERLWQPIWRAAGMDFVFQNGGEVS